MNIQKIKKAVIFLAVLTVILLLNGCSAPGGTNSDSKSNESQSISNGQIMESELNFRKRRPRPSPPPDGISSNGEGTYTSNGKTYFYTFWKPNNATGNQSMTVNGRHYTSTCSGSGGVWGIGKQKGSSAPIYFGGSYSSSYGGAFGVYGWAENPNVEYYICESYPMVNPTNSPDCKGHDHMKVGTFNSDGSDYDIYLYFREGYPGHCGSGNQNFWQYISIRKDQRTSGTITMQNHINAWASTAIKYSAADSKYPNAITVEKNNTPNGGKMTLNISSDYQIVFTEFWPEQDANGDNKPGATVTGNSYAAILDYPSSKVLLNSFYNGGYLRLQADNSVLPNDSDGQNMNCIWYMCDVGNSQMAFMSAQNNNYLTVDSSGNVKATTGTTPTTAEKFTRECIYYYNWLKSSQNSKYFNYQGKATTSGQDATSTWYIFSIY